MQKIIGLGNTNPTKTIREIIAIFVSEDWDTLIVSALVLLLNLVAHFIIAAYTTLPNTVEYYPLYSFGAALVLGYAGQRLIYKYLGSAEKFLDKKVDAKLQ